MSAPMYEKRILTGSPQAQPGVTITATHAGDATGVTATVAYPNAECRNCGEVLDFHDRGNDHCPKCRAVADDRHRCEELAAFYLRAASQFTQQMMRIKEKAQRDKRRVFRGER